MAWDPTADEIRGLLDSERTYQPITAQHLMSLTFAEPRWAVPGLIPEGLFLLAARPKSARAG